jgi:hypothetical protein
MEQSPYAFCTVQSIEIVRQVQNPVRVQLSVDELQLYGVEGLEDIGGEQEEPGRPIFSPPILELTDDCITDINSIISSQSDLQCW